jgi:hypothetical protein
MPRIPLGELEEAIQNPAAYKSKLSKARTAAGFGPTYFSALRDSVFRYHAYGESLTAAEDYLFRRLSRFKSEEHQQEIVDQFRWYIIDYLKRDAKAFACRYNISILLPKRLSKVPASQDMASLVLSGEISRLDINNQPKGYGAWLFRSRGFGNWSDELRMPLIQDTLASKMGVNARDVMVGIYSFEEKYCDCKCYSDDDIVLAKSRLDDLLAALGF